MPSPKALFALLPLSDRAHEVLRSPRNKRFLSKLGNGTPVLDIGHVRSKSANSSTLVTLGRDGDIVLEGGNISKTHCSFEIDPDTHVVMFYDRSHSQTCQVYGQPSYPFQYGRPRKIAVLHNLNGIIGIGGVGRDLFQFRIKWYQDTLETIEKARERGEFALDENSHLAETIDESETAPVSGRETRLHTAGALPLPIRWTSIGHLGSGTFGDVHKGIDIDHGKFIAVKSLRGSGAGGNAEKLRAAWFREAKILSTMKHPHIIEYIWSQGWDVGPVNIIMPLKDGSLTSLMELQNRLCTTKEIIRLASYQILQAIDFLATRAIVHRDIKPDNILYSVRSNQYHFELSDFGLSNYQAIANTMAGTMEFMAPELHQYGVATHKSDVWSLFVALLWTSENKGFRKFVKTHKGMEGFHAAIAALGSQERLVVDMMEMIALNPEERASAAQMLLNYYGGQGLSTPLRQIPPLFSQRQLQAPMAGYQNPNTAYQLVGAPLAVPADYQDLPIGHQGVPIGHQAFHMPHDPPPTGNKALLMAHPTLPVAGQATPRQATGQRATARKALATPHPPHLGPGKNANPKTPRKLAPKPPQNLGDTVTHPNFPGAQPPARLEYP
ncbi:kinase-like domain-containing protein [Xylaria telfairii]|nr:kinase-like domain-containing protein [Xylaria telfairii]